MVSPVEGVSIDVVLAAEIFSPGTSLSFFEDLYDLFFGVSAVHSGCPSRVLSISTGLN